MSLTAMTPDGDYFNPSLRIEAGEPESQVVQDMRDLSEFGLFCPHCHHATGELCRVGFRNSEVRRKHFYHLEALDGGRNCTNYTNEGERHISAKAAIARWLQQRGKNEIKLEHQLREPGLRFRRPDITCQNQDMTLEAHEIQLSPISAKELEQRTEDLLAHGAGIVAWYLGGKNYTRELRRLCARLHKVKRYRLTFEGSEADSPVWAEDLASIDEAPPKTASPYLDSCSKSAPLPVFLPTASQNRDMVSNNPPEAVQRLIRKAKAVPGQFYNFGEPVTNSLGWHGWIVGAEQAASGIVYRVWWHERANPAKGTDKAIARAWERSPVLTKPESEIVLPREGMTDAA